MAASSALSAFAARLGADAAVALTSEGLPVLDAAGGEELSASYAGVELVLGDAGPSLGAGAAGKGRSRRVRGPPAPRVARMHPPLLRPHPRLSRRSPAAPAAAAPPPAEAGVQGRGLKTPGCC